MDLSDVVPVGLIATYATATAIVGLILNIAFATAVHVDARNLQVHRRRTVLVGSGLWALATFVGGVFVAAIYWALHHSSLNVESRAS